MTLVCPNCFGEKGLKRRIQEIRPDFPNKKCSFHPRYKGVPIQDIAEIIDQVFRDNYGFGEINRYHNEQEGDSLENVIADLTEVVDEIISQEVVRQLIEDEDVWPQDGDEPFYQDDQNYIRYHPNDYHHSELWRNFCGSITHDQRFFNTKAKELIAEIFDGIHLQKNVQKQSPIFEITPGDPEAVFFRARIANAESVRNKIGENPSNELGTPPKRDRLAGRMNPAGIATFYGAFEMPTCIAELRPVVGSIIMGAQFQLVRPIHVLDTTRFQAPVKETSLFTKDHIKRIQQWSFMQSFMREIAEPIFPGDQHIDYIPTQAVAEYLLHHHSFKRHRNPARIEGIIYQSAQYPQGKNIALLGDAACVTTLTGTNIREKTSSAISGLLPDSMANFLTERNLAEPPGLMLIEGSIQTLHVGGAKYEAKERARDHYDDVDLDF